MIRSFASWGLSQLIRAISGHGIYRLDFASMSLPTQIPSYPPEEMRDRPVLGVSAATSVTRLREESLLMTRSEMTSLIPTVELIAVTLPVAEKVLIDAGRVFVLLGGCDAEAEGIFSSSLGRM